MADQIQAGMALADSSAPVSMATLSKPDLLPGFSLELSALFGAAPGE